MVTDPNRKEREEEESLRKEVKASKKQWRKIRRERFPFLDGADGTKSSVASKTSGNPNVEEKKIDDTSVDFGR